MVIVSMGNDDWTYGCNYGDNMWWMLVIDISDIHDNGYKNGFNHRKKVVDPRT